jgi:hypothetical protein
MARIRRSPSPSTRSSPLAGRIGGSGMTDTDVERGGSMRVRWDQYIRQDAI